MRTVQLQPISEKSQGIVPDLQQTLHELNHVESTLFCRCLHHAYHQVCSWLLPTVHPKWSSFEICDIYIYTYIHACIHTYIHTRTTGSFRCFFLTGQDVCFACRSRVNQLCQAILFRCSPSFPWPCLADSIRQVHGMVTTTRSHRNPMSRQRTGGQVVFKRVGVFGLCWVYSGLYHKRSVEI